MLARVAAHRSRRGGKQECLAEHPEALEIVSVDVAYYTLPNTQYLEGVAELMLDDFLFSLKVGRCARLRGCGCCLAFSCGHAVESRLIPGPFDPHRTPSDFGRDADIRDQGFGSLILQLRKRQPIFVWFRG